MSSFFGFTRTKNSVEWRAPRSGVQCYMKFRLASLPLSRPDTISTWRELSRADHLRYP